MAGVTEPLEVASRLADNDLERNAAKELKQQLSGDAPSACRTTGPHPALRPPARAWRRPSGVPTICIGKSLIPGLPGVSVEHAQGRWGTDCERIRGHECIVVSPQRGADEVSAGRG